MSTTSVKVLAVGSASGAISNLLAKVKTINAKHGPFELLLCTGDFFGPPETASDNEDLELLLNSKLEFPIPTYIMQGEQPVPPKIILKISETNGQICPNVHLMGKANLLVTAQGLRIGIFGGKYDAAAFDIPATDAHPLLNPTFNSETLKTFLASPLLPQSTTDTSSIATSKAALNQYVDIVMTHEWPIGITQQSTAPLPDPEASSWGVAPVQSIARLRPRYHFASGGGPKPVFWERQPYVWAEDSRITRFVSLGAFGGPEPEAGKKKERWFYAFSIAPQTEMAPPLPRPANATASPFDFKPGVKRDFNVADSGENFRWGQGAKRPRMAEGEKPPPGYVCKICQSTEHFIRECPQKSAPKGVPPGYTCKICESTEHFIKDCPRRSDAENTPPESYICKICQKPGHFVRHCPEKSAVGDTGGRKPPPGYTCRACGSEAHLINDCPSSSARPHGSRGGQRKEIGPDECWFCLSNPRVTKHLIITIGSECYVTAPKGQLPPPNEPGVPGVPGGGHVLIIPISHYPTLQAVPAELSIPIISEIEQFKSALRDLYAKHDHVAVAFEVARLTGKGGHAHVQVIPVPSALAGKVEAQFRADGQAAGIPWEEDADEALERAAQANDNYFKVDLPDGKKLVHIMGPGRPFNLQFGRVVLANLLGLQDRIDWKACAPSEADEKKDAAALKAAFGPFDPASH